MRMARSSTEVGSEQIAQCLPLCGRVTTNVDCMLKSLPSCFAVSRITAKSVSTLAMHITLDYANELISLSPKDKITVCLAKTLDTKSGGSNGNDDQAMAVDGQPGVDSGRAKREMWRGGEQGLAEGYDYVMYGKVSELAPNTVESSFFFFNRRSADEAVRHADLKILVLYCSPLPLLSLHHLFSPRTPDLQIRRRLQGSRPNNCLRLLRRSSLSTQGSL